MARYHGKTGTIYLATTGAGTAIATVSLSAWTLDRTTAKEPVIAFGDTNINYVTGFPDVKGTISGWFDSSDDALFDGADSADGIKLYLYPSSLAPTIYHYGPAWLDASVNVPANGPASISGTFVANGAWGRKP